jgi:hypothetical protein
MNVESSHTLEGGKPSCFSLSKTNSSMKFFAGGKASMEAPSGTVASKTSTSD